MATDTKARSGARQKQETGFYVYGVVPSDVETTDEARGVGDPPASVETVTHEDIAALVSEIPREAELGKPEDLAAHARLLDATAATSPVLPLRFGAVLADRDAVEQELLAANHDDFASALRELEGRMEFIVKGRYEQDAVLREVLDENDRARQLREAITDKPGDATREHRIELGEIVTESVAAKRDRDTADLVETLRPLEFDGAMREPSHERDAVYVAYLVNADRQDEFREAVDAWAGRHGDRIDVRLLGPVAPYDFVVTAKPEG